MDAGQEGEMNVLAEGQVAEGQAPKRGAKPTGPPPETADFFRPRHKGSGEASKAWTIGFTLVRGAEYVGWAWDQACKTWMAYDSISQNTSNLCRHGDKPGSAAKKNMMTGFLVKIQGLVVVIETYDKFLSFLPKRPTE